MSCHPPNLKDSLANYGRKDILGLMGNGTFVPVKISYLTVGTRGFGSRIVEYLKKANIGVFFLYRLVANTYTDEG